jgi:hypothetical protein
MSSSTETETQTVCSAQEVETQSGAQVSSLIDDVKKLAQDFNKQKTDQRNELMTKGTVALYEHIKELIPEKLKTYAKFGKTEARVLEFEYKDALKFEGSYAKDLLTRGTVISKLQDYLDTNHFTTDSKGEKEPAFMVYFNIIGHKKPENKDNKYGVFVNWDKSSWESIKKRQQYRLQPQKRYHPQKSSFSKATDGKRTQMNAGMNSGRQKINLR